MTSPSFDRRLEDVGNIVEFGHVNLRVPDQQLAIVFYVMGLGLTRDPYLVTGIENGWINVGTSQFHLPVGAAQVLRGAVGIVMQDLDALVARLEAIRPRMAGTRFGFAADRTQVEVTCPWGNRIRVHAPDAKRFGPLLLGIPYVELDVPTGTVTRIQRFYREMLGALTSSGNDFVRINAGKNESLVYRETTRAIASYDGHHVQITVADFSGVHRRLLERGLVSEESSQSQYRFENIVDLDTGAVLLSLEHEVRSLRHPLHGRYLVNRNPAITNNAFATGHEVALWHMGLE